MPKDERFLPRQITHFNYWEFDIASPRTLQQQADTFQRLGDFPEECWTARRGKSAAHQHIQQTFHLLLNATPEIWERDIRPWLHKLLSAMKDRRYFALRFFVENDKEWYGDETAQEVKRGLSSSQRAAINQLERRKWPRRSKRPEPQRQRTWSNLLSEIADDVGRFENYIDNPPSADERTGNEQRIYRGYRNQAIKLLGGGGKYISPSRRHIYQMPSPLDDSDNPSVSTCVNRNGRIESRSHFSVNWLDLTTQDAKRNALKLTLHWFHHTLRNLHEYRDKRQSIPWTPQCEGTCRRVCNKLLVPRTPRQR